MTRPRHSGATRRMVVLLATAFAPTFFPGATPANAAPAYLADVSNAAGGTVSLSLELPDALSPRPTHVAARALPVGVESQIGRVACDGAPLSSDDGGWRLPDGCRKVSWTVALPRATGGVAADDQRSLFFDTDWGILADSAFLRPAGWNGRADLRIVGDRRPDRDATLPSLDTAPAFYLIGNPPALQVGGQSNSLVYVTEKPEEVLALISPDQHLAALTYLREVIGAASLRDVPELTAVWLPVSRSSRGLGGAAGENAMLVNYIGASESPTPAEALMPFVILLHEQFHQLIAAGLPLWASESLAQYYAFKAATRTARDGAAIAGLWSQLPSGAHAEPGLLAVQRQVTQRGDPANYGLFYSQGPAFWRELDRAIQEATGGSRTLDSIMPLVLESGFGADGRLSASLRESLRPISDDQIDTLENLYL